MMLTKFTREFYFEQYREDILDALHIVGLLGLDRNKVSFSFTPGSLVFFLDDKVFGDSAHDVDVAMRNRRTVLIERIGFYGRDSTITSKPVSCSSINPFSRYFKKQFGKCDRFVFFIGDCLENMQDKCIIRGTFVSNP